MSPSISKLPRRQCIPIIYTRGTHYEVGFDVVGLLVINHPQLLLLMVGERESERQTYAGDGYLTF